MVYIEINNERYAVKNFNEVPEDYGWNRRKTCHVTLEMDYATASELFKDDITWSLVIVESYDTIVTNEDGTEQYQTTETEKARDLSAYSILGDIVIHNNGFATIVMGQPTAEELLAILLGE